MKRIVKKILRAMLRKMGFLLQPLRAELEANLKTCVAGSFDEVRLVMDDLVSEVFRLQQQVSDLKDEMAKLNDQKYAESSSL